MRTAIAIEGVTKRFGSVVAVDQLDLKVPRGLLYGFIGPNGSGKSTTLRMIMNILLPDQGEVEVLGQRDTRAAHDRVSYLPEERGLYKRMSVRRLLRYFGSLKGARQPELDQSIDQWLEKMGLSDWIDKKIDALSKGMAQKVQFVATVLNRPDLLILDEPFTGLDPVNAEVLKDAVLDLKRAGTTVVFSTHDMSVAERLCDRIFRGRKVLDGTLDQIRSIYGYDTIRVRTEAGIAALEGWTAWTKSTISATSRRCAGGVIPRSCCPPSRPGRGSTSSRSPVPRCTTSSSGLPPPTRPPVMKKTSHEI
jgi:ABC-2 type transport system ATP-binding protein